jgi:hypothetical protein
MTLKCNRYDLLTQEQRNIHLFICIQKPHVKVGLAYANMVHWSILGEQFHERQKILDVFTSCHNVDGTNLAEGGCDP